MLVHHSCLRGNCSSSLVSSNCGPSVLFKPMLSSGFHIDVQNPGFGFLVDQPKLERCVLWSGEPFPLSPTPTI